MPMLHGCAFPGCETLTLSAYCFEHELLIRAEVEAERAQLVIPAGRGHTDAPQAAA